MSISKSDSSYSVSSLLPKCYCRLANRLIAPFQPREPELRVIVADLDAKQLRYNRKVDALAFFPPFCKVLAQYGIGSRFVHDVGGMEQAVGQRDCKAVLVSLVDEDRSDLGRYDLPGELLGRFLAVFNSRGIAGILRDRRLTNEYLSSHGVRMPGCDATGGRVFSLPRTGYGHGAAVPDEVGESNDASYDTEFIDTRVRFRGRSYYTSLRLMCVGPVVLKILAQARDCDERDPAARSRNTPQDPELLEHLRFELAATGLGRILAFGQDVWRALGPGFYAHDLLVKPRFSKASNIVGRSN